MDKASREDVKKPVTAFNTALYKNPDGGIHSDCGKESF
jgi:hypothetical protein